MIRYALIALLLAGCGGCVSVPEVPTHAELRETAHRLKFEGGICSGTAVGPDLLVTAQHCGTLTHVGEAPVTAEVVERGPRDSMVLRVSGITFDRYAKRGAMPGQGDRLRWWGNPVGQADMYREGYVARVTEREIVIAAVICKGDSGAGLHNDAGEVVGVVSAMTATQHCQFALSLP